ncbi:tripartite tricarboxylate transporter substrate binding protein [Sesbania bispinosa]|nr:tripartite tricarboxylate transporter substrate binding protein [Sesbania bispinosa]
MSDLAVNRVLPLAGAANPSSTTRNHPQRPVLFSSSSISCQSDMTCEISSAFKGKAEEDTPLIMKVMPLVGCP